MSTDLSAPEVLYRDRDLTKVRIERTVRQNFVENRIQVVFAFYCDALRTESVVTLLGIELDEVRDVLDQIHEQCLPFAKWWILNGKYRERQQIELGYTAADGGRYRHNPTLKTFSIEHEALKRVAVEEFKLARRIILSLLYPETHLIDSNIRGRAHFPERAIQAELNGLRASKFAAFVPMQGTVEAQTFLTLEGREYYEKSAVSGTVFIIAACEPPEEECAMHSGLKASHAKILRLYKDVIEGVPLTPRFQEHEEPSKNIYQDIFDYIDLSEFVVADITWQKPNCYVEIGYALGKGKHVILFVEEEYFKSTMNEKLPFDLFPIKYRNYVRDSIGLHRIRDQLCAAIEARLSQRRAAL